MNLRKRPFRAVGLIASVGLVSLGIVALNATPALASDRTVTLDPSTQYQTMDGFGTDINATSGTDPSLANMSSSAKSAIFDLLFSKTTGAGLSMLRLEALSGLNYSTTGFTIEPTGPSTASGTPTYTWDDSADDLVQFAQQAQTDGATGFYLNAWSPPAFMKAGGDITGAAGLCGEGNTCSSGDWRAAYADYLAKYVSDFASDGIPIEAVDPMNEPNIASSYQGMTMSPSEAADLVKVVHDRFVADSITAKVACCDVAYPDTAASYVDAIMSDPTAAADLGVATTHGYQPSTPVPVTAIPSASAAGIPTWMTEFSEITSEAFNTTYTGGSPSGSDPPTNGQDTSDHIMAALLGGVSAYFDFVGDLDESSGYAFPNQTLIANTSSSTYTVSKRLWAYGNYSRFIRPGAVRIGSSSGDSNLKTVAFTNTDGSTAVVLNSHNTSDLTTTIAGVSGGTYATYVTDDSSNLAATSSGSVGTSGSVDITVPANSTVTVEFTGTTVTAPESSSEPLPISSASMDATPFAGYGADKAVDGDTTTYAQSNSATPWDLTVDLGADRSVGSVVFTPDTETYATEYTIQVSTAAAPTTWTTVATESSGDGTVKTYDFSPVTARYVKLAVSAEQTAGDWGHAVREFAVYGPSASLTTWPVESASMDATPFGGGYGADKTIDGDLTTYAQSPTLDWSLSTDLGADHPVSQVTLTTDALNYAVGFTIDTATAAAPTTWTTVATETAGAGGTKTYDFTSTTARYVRVHVTSENVTGGTSWGHAIDEISIAG